MQMSGYFNVDGVRAPANVWRSEWWRLTSNGQIWTKGSVGQKDQSAWLARVHWEIVRILSPPQLEVKAVVGCNGGGQTDEALTVAVVAGE